MAKKGQKFQTYSFETKKKAIEMRLQGITVVKIAEELGIVDVGRVKTWMRRYKQTGEFGLSDTRGKRKEYVDENRYVKRLEMENAVLKKWLAITKAEVYQKSVGSLKSSESIPPLQIFVKKSVSPRADSMPILNEEP
ncbi:helix-turn-helix domain-containing protein [Paenibacillus sp. JDR-2]|uniref:helix-turn-helix domain-containing protein n=1 Tax=Paenibacillus sp. (strain JDR-2) TaxID=324057 RepID=UPI000166A3E9|nr:helix-turn-helix domain-containing protein [Paenibacillus sp. JDR-2]